MSEENGAIHEDATSTRTALTEEQAVQAFLDRHSKDADKPSEQEDPGERGSDEEDFASDEHESSDTEDESLEVSEDAEDAKKEEAKARRIASDEDEVEIKVGEENLKLSVKDLKRLHGQEYALNKKSMEVAELRKFNESKAAFLDKKLDANLTRAEQRWKEYETVDLNLAAADLAKGVIDENTYHSLKAEMVARWDELQTAQKERREFREAAEAERTRTEQERFERVKAQIIAQHPNVDELAPKVQSYAMEKGLTQDELRQFFHPVVFDALNKARLYDEAYARKPEIKKVVAEPAKVLKPQTATAKSSNSADDAMRRARKSGSMDDAVAALLARRGIN